MRHVALGLLLGAIISTPFKALADGAAQPATYNVFQEKLRQQKQEAARMVQPQQSYYAPAPAAPQQQAVPSPTVQNRPMQEGKTYPTVDGRPAQTSEQAASPSISEPRRAAERDAGDINPIYPALGTVLLIGLGFLLVL